MSKSFDKGRIVKNSIYLYVRMLFTMWLNLYATRLTLTNLGIEDMGVYSVIGSIVTLFTMFTGGITNAVQRFVTFEMGLKDGQPNKVFCSSLNVIFILSVLMVVVLEVGGLWMLNHKVNIPEDSRDASFWVFQLSVLTCIVNTISIPYNALIIAHEKMDAFSIISIVQVVLNFFAAYCLSFFADNRLLIYAVMLAAASLFVRILYQMYCHQKFEEAKYRWEIDWGRLKEIGRFTGVSSVSSFLQVFATYGINIVMNVIFGVTINAVYEIAIKLKLSFISFAQNILKAISPQITKTYANHEFDKFNKLITTGSKFQVILLLFIYIPFVFRAEYIIRLWLGEVPQYVVPYSIIAVTISVIYAVLEPVRSGVIATNRIKKFMLYPDTFYLLVLPLIYFVCNATKEPLYLMICILIMELLACIYRAYYAMIACKITIKTVIRKILCPCFNVFISSFIFCYLISRYFPESLTGLLGLLIVNCLFLMVAVYFMALTVEEKKYILQIVKKVNHFRI